MVEKDPRLKKSDFDINVVDFDWVTKTNDPRQLKRALKALQDDGGYEALESALREKLDIVAPELRLPSN